MTFDSLYDLYVDELKDLYSAENMILAALPKMINAASNPDLRNGLQQHLDVTREQVNRLNQIFGWLGTDGRGKTCKGMEGLIAEGNEFLQQQSDPDVKDAGIISMCQRIEHYEMAGYGCCRTYAKQLDLPDQQNLLQQTLDEEGDADKLLTKVAENRKINKMAAKAA